LLVFNHWAMLDSRAGTGIPKMPIRQPTKTVLRKEYRREYLYLCIEIQPEYRRGGKWRSRTAAEWPVTRRRGFNNVSVEGALQLIIHRYG